MAFSYLSPHAVFYSLVSVIVVVLYQFLLLLKELIVDKIFMNSLF